MIQTTRIGSSTVSRTPATAGPARKATPNTPWRIAAIRSSVTPLVRLTRPIRVSRAVMPGTSNRAPSTPRTTNQPMSRPNAQSTMASPATENALPMSAMMLIRRCPTWSISQPPTRVARIDGTAATAATSAATDGSPVRLSTSQGSTMLIDALPNRDSASAATKRGSVVLWVAVGSGVVLVIGRFSNPDVTSRSRAFWIDPPTLAA